MLQENLWRFLGWNLFTGQMPDVPPTVTKNKCDCWNHDKKICQKCGICH